MREDLIERLQLKRDVWRGTEFGDDICELLEEAEDAIEAAQVDAERYRRLRAGDIDDIAVVRGLGAMDYGMSGVAYTYSEEIDGDDLDAAIDQARGKGGGEVGP